MDRRQFISVVSITGLVGSISGCTSNSTNQSDQAEISELEVWNSDDKKHNFQVTLLDSSNTIIYNIDIKLSAASKNHFTREVLSDAPHSATKIQAKVGNKTEKKELTVYEEPVQISVKYNSENELGIAVFI